MILAGGTGGHIFPGLAVADVLRDSGWRVSWMGSAGGMEEEIVPKRGYSFFGISFRPPKGNLIADGFRLLCAAKKARGILIPPPPPPDVILGMGGFASAPGGIAGATRGIPLLIHEQNSIPGRANQLLSRIAKKILTAYPGVWAKNPKAECVGNPVRDEFFKQPPPQERFAGRQGPLRFLILGGSRGASVFNEMIPKGLASLPPNLRPIVVHQCGRGNLSATVGVYRKCGVDGEVREFIDDVAGEMARADLIICRAGAMSAAEVAAVGAAAMMVPYPHAAADHQTANAKFFAARDAAEVIPQNLFAPEVVAAAAAASRESLCLRAAAAKKLAIPDAASKIAQACREVADAP